MATEAEVEVALGQIIGAALYPAGPSSVGIDVLVSRGWPQMRELDDALTATPPRARVSVNRTEGMVRDTTRYGREWRVLSTVAPGVTVTVSDRIATFAGQAVGGEVAGVTVGGVDYPLVLAAGQTGAQVAAGLAQLVTAGTLCVGTATGAALTVAGADGVPLPIGAVVVGTGTSARELGRSESEYTVSVFAPSFATRDAIEAAVMAALDAVDRLQLSDGPSGPLRFARSRIMDAAEGENLFRVDLGWRIETGRSAVASGPAMAFGCATLDVLAGGLSARFVVGGQPLPTAMVIPPLGAIRFDAWYDPANAIDGQCAAALSPAQWNGRLPPNATVTAGVATWPVATQATMDAEIAAARVAGLGFWAFDSYQPGDTLSLALKLFLSSTARAGFSFAMLGQSTNWADTTRPDGYSAAFGRDIGLMTAAGYLTVLGGRPVYLVLDGSADQLAALPAGLPGAIAALRARVQAAGGGNPYVVLVSGAALADYDNTLRAAQIGADAAAAYCTPRLNGSEQPFAALAGAAEADWAARAARPMPMLPTAMTGWDQRPLIQTPQPFYPISSYLSMGNYYDTAQPAEIGAHITTMAAWINNNPASCPAQIGLVYAWNELAEGGWLMPTYTAAGSDLTRCAATGATLAAAVTASRTGKPVQPLLVGGIPVRLAGSPVLLGVEQPSVTPLTINGAALSLSGTFVEME